MSLDKCYFTREPIADAATLSDNQYHLHSAAWFADFVVNHECADELISGLCGDDPMARAGAYMEIIGNYGAYEFDQYPIELTRKETIARYKKMGVK